jgi:hypothetical protein
MSKLPSELALNRHKFQDNNYARSVRQPFYSNTGLRLSREMAVATIGPFQMLRSLFVIVTNFTFLPHFLLRLWRNEILPIIYKHPVFLDVIIMYISNTCYIVYFYGFSSNGFFSLRACMQCMQTCMLCMQLCMCTHVRMYLWSGILWFYNRNSARMYPVVKV